MYSISCRSDLVKYCMPYCTALRNDVSYDMFPVKIKVNKLSSFQIHTSIGSLWELTTILCLNSIMVRPWLLRAVSRLGTGDSPSVVILWDPSKGENINPVGSTLHCLQLILTSIDLPNAHSSTQSPFKVKHFWNCVIDMGFCEKKHKLPCLLSLSDENIWRKHGLY